MKKILSVVLTIILSAFFGGVALAKERVVQLTVPGCSTWSTKSRIGSILKKIDGVKKHENKANNRLIITFDDEQTTLKIITDELKKGKFVVEGKPVYLK